MSNDDLDLDDIELEPADGEDEAALVRRLRGVIREKTKQTKQLQSQVNEGSEAKKRLAFIEAKLPDEPQIKFFLDHYDGDYTPEAIRAAAASSGFITVDAGTQDDVNAVEQMMNANSGASTGATPGSDAELEAKINAVKPGPNASKQIRDIMVAAGRFESDE